MDISIPYYEDLTRISNSNIGWFLKKGPKYLKEMLDGKEGLKASFLDKGTMIHEYILQPEEFWKDYIILDFAVPKVKQQKDLLEFYSTARLVDPFASEDDILIMSYEAAYNNNKSAIYISNIEYCGGDNNIEYKKIECTLYETSGNIERKIKTYNSDKNQNIKLETFLKQITLVVNNYEKVCKEYSDNSLYLLINATDKSDKTTTYKVPLKIEENCNK